jgi:CubicO group peptidase (beta-lactamase class C family)
MTTTLRRWSVRIGLALLAVLLVWPAAAVIVYPGEYVRRVLLWRESDVGDYLHNFPARPLTASPQPRPFDDNPDPGLVAMVVETFETEIGTADGFADEQLDGFLADTDTQALLVIHNDRLVLERYGPGIERASLLTSFSVAKSFVSTLVGIAVEQGHITSIGDPVTDYLPELTDRDSRFSRITVRDLLTMSSGLDYQAFRWWFFNGDDPLTTYHPDQRELCLSHPDIVTEPDRRFLYNKCHPQLLGMILERTTGRSVTEFTQRELWDPLGMEYDGSWSLDSEDSGFEKMEAGLNARAVDFAKLGRLFLDDGQVDGRRLVSADWVTMASGTDPAGRAPEFDQTQHYGFMWWAWTRDDGAVDYAAWGDRGQFVFVSPSNDVVIVRHGRNYGLDAARWFEGFTDIADRLGR